MKDKIIAALLALFFGIFGVHHFYLGNKTKGILYLVFCWTIIPGIIAFVEGILFLVEDQKTFDEKYNSGIPSGTHNSSYSVAAEIERLYDLKSRGIITEAEFLEQKRKLL